MTRWTDHDRRLPVFAHRHAVRQALDHSTGVVVSAPPGSGKTMVLPRAVVEPDPLRSDDELQPRGVLVVQPRRLAARLAAAELARRVDGRIGDEVGLAFRGLRRVGSSTTITVTTAGYALRWIASNQELPGLGTVLLDEFHERSIEMDLLLAMLRDVALVRDDLRIVVMSATVARDTSDRLGWPLVEIPSEPHPLSIRHVGRRLAPAALRSGVPALAVDALGATAGSVLAFVPRRVDADAIADECRTLLGGRVPVHSLHGGTSPEDVGRAAQPHRRLIIATSIAESSVTLDGVDLVVDSGWSRRPLVDQSAGMGGLVTRHVSAASAAQRAGRAARQGPGTVWRLWSAREDHELPAHDPPMVHVGDLTDAVLHATSWAGHVDRLDWYDAPAPAGVASSLRLLERVRLCEGGRLSELGRIASSLPCGAREAAMLLRCPHDAVRLAAELVEPVDRRARGRLLDAVHRARRRLVPIDPEIDTEHWGPGELFALGYPDRLGRNRGQRDGRFATVIGKGLRTRGSLGDERWIVATDVSFVDGDATVRTGYPVTERVAQTLASAWASDSTAATWGGGQRPVRVTATSTAGGIALATSHRPPAANELDLVVGIVDDAIASAGWDVLPQAHRCAQLRERVAVARVVSPLADETEPPIRRRVLACAASTGPLDRPDRWDLEEALWWVWTEEGRHPEWRTRLEREVPTRLRLANGHMVAVSYTDGTAVVSLRVQELFGVTEPVDIASRRVRFDLLSPASRVVAITDDPGRFWRVGYPAVRGEMRGRYPKHWWPDDGAAEQPPRPQKRR